MSQPTTTAADRRGPGRARQGERALAIHLEIAGADPANDDLKLEVASDYNRLVTKAESVAIYTTLRQAGTIEGSDLETLEANRKALERVRKELSR